MNQSLCIERIEHFGRGRRGGKFCLASRKRCPGVKAFFCVGWDVLRCIGTQAARMLLMMETE